MTTKRAYKLQEFVAHASAVNCLKIGRKSSRFLLTGGEDHKVNLWSIGKPNAILSLSGHTTGIDSVTFDSSEILAVAGAASGTIKLWDLEERKLVRTLTGHRSNCVTLDFHPFGEFIASGSLDTNLKIWDMRKKGSLDTYKGHLRGITVTRFTPDGRWVVSGGEDHAIKIWDLTAGKLLHDFKCHEGKIQCIDFHPQQFLLATGSADKSLKFLDLQTFQFVGSSGPETSAVSCIKFNPDGKSLLCGLHENLKILSWEPVKCHDTVDVGWSKLGDLNIHEGKLLGCSYNQGCVGIWVADISRLRPYAIGLGVSENGARPIPRRMRTGEVMDITRETLSVEGLSVSVSHSSDSDTRDLKIFPSTGCRTSATTPRIICNSLARSASKRVIGRVSPSPGAVSTSKCDVIPVIVPRVDTRSAAEHGVESRKEVILVENTNALLPSQSRLRRSSSRGDSPCRPSFSDPPVNVLEESNRCCNNGDNAESIAAIGRRHRSGGSPDSGRGDGNSSSSVGLVSRVMEHHEQFISSMRSRLCKLNVVRRYWERTDVKGAMNSVGTMCDGGVLADLIGVMAKRADGVNTVDVCCSILPLLATSLLDARIERHLGVSLEMVATVVRTFGPVVYSTVSATSSSSSTGVDIEAEQRSGRCKICFVELEKIKQCLPHLSRRGGLIGRRVQQLKLAFAEVTASVG